MLTAAADEEEGAMDGAVKGLEGWIACFEKARMAGVVRGVGADAMGAIKKLPSIMQEAYNMGKSI